jgi:hypothetical protein
MPCGAATLEIAAALNHFADIALPDRLMDRTRDLAAGLHDSLTVRSGDVTPPRPIGMIVGATGMDACQFQNVTGGTIPFSEIKAGGR